MIARFRRSAMNSMKARTSTIHSELASVASSCPGAWPLICCHTVSLLIRAECFAVGGWARPAICGPHATASVPDAYREPRSAIRSR